MKINGLIPYQAIKTYTNHKKSEGVSKKSDINSRDSAEISKQAQELHALSKVSSSIPDIRMEKVSEIRERLSMYQIDLDQLADNIIDEMVESRIIRG